MTDIIIDNEYITVQYRSDIEAVHHTFHQAIEGYVLRNALDAGIGVLQRYGAIKWLSDDRNNAGVSPEDTEWSMNDWGPRAAEAGWKYWALVVPESIAGRVDMSGIVQRFWELGVRVNVFTSVEDAEDWLRSV